MKPSFFQKSVAAIGFLSIVAGQVLTSVSGALPTLPDLSALLNGGCVFTDVCDAKDPYYAPIKYLKEKNLIKGNPDGSYGSERTVNRAEIITIAYRGFDKAVTYSSSNTFKDIPAGEWYAPYISTAKKEGFINGNPDGTYKPGNPVNMAESSKIFLNFYKVKTPNLDGLNGNYTYDQDDNSYSNDWFSKYVRPVEDFSLLVHSGSFNYIKPESAMLRKDIALMLYNLLMAKEDMKKDLTVLSSWSEDNSNVSEGSPLLFFFNKPVDLVKAKSFIKVSIDGVQTTNFDISETRWPQNYDKQKAGLEDYKYKLHELKVDSPLFVKGRLVKIEFLLGLLDIYGTTLLQNKTFSYKYVEQGGYIDLGSHSYFLMSESKNILLGQKGNSRITAYLCSVPVDTYLKQLEYNSASDLSSRSVSREYFDVFGRNVKSQIDSRCNSVKEATLDTNVVKETASNIDLEQIFNTKLTGGIYYIYFSSPEITAKTPDPSAAKNHKFIYVTDTSITLKSDGNGYNTKNALVWATDVTTSEPRANLKVEFFNNGGAKDSNTNQYSIINRGSVVTSSNGTAMFTPNDVPVGSNAYWGDTFAIARGDGHFGIVSTTWNNGIESYEFNLPWQYEAYDKQLDNYTLHVYTDRKIYRPGHEVNVKGFIRENKSNGLALPGLKQVEVVIKNPEYKDTYSFRADVSSHGTFDGSYLLPDTAYFGNYTIEIKNPKPGEGQYNLSASTFQVEAYRKPEFRVAISGIKEDYMSGESLDASASAEYYFGAKVTDGSYDWILSRDTLYWQPVKDYWYSFSDGSFCGYSCNGSSENTSYGNGSITNGVIPIKEKLDLSDTPHGGMYTLTINAYDQNNRMVTERTTFRVHKADQYAGIRALNYMQKEGVSPEFEIVTVNKDGSILANKSVEVDLYSEEWTSVSKLDMSGSNITENQNVEKKLETKTVVSDAKGIAKVSFTSQKPGSYYALVHIKDNAGRENKAREYTYVYSANTSDFYISWPMDDALKTSLLIDKPTYAIGDNLNMIVQSPFKKSKVLVTFEKDSILDSYVVDLPNNATPITLPIKASYAPNVFVSAVVQNASGTPGLRMAYANVAVNTDKLTLGIKLTTDKETYKPGETVTVSVDTTSANGNGIPAELSLAVVDESVIALAGGVDRDIVNAFYSLKNLGIETAHSLTHYLKDSILRTAGGGGKGGSSGLPQVRGNMKDTAYWNAKVSTNNEGKATVSFVLPDNLTRWELLAQGATDSNLFGSQAKEIQTTQDLVILPVLPRFVRTGDKVKLSYTLYNTKAGADSLTVSISSKDMANIGSPKTVSVPSFGSARVSWDVTVPSTLTSLELTTSAQGSRLADSLSITLPVEMQSIPDAVAKSAGITGTASLDISVPTGANYNATKGGLTLTVSPGILGSLRDDLKYLLTYPYGCTEQLVSSTLPNVLLKKYIKDSGKALEGVSMADLDSRVYTGLQKIYANQQADGRFSLWGDDSTYESLYLTAYTLEFLIMAKDAGYAVDATVLTNGKAYLGTKMNGEFENDDEYLYAINIYQLLGGTNIESAANGVIARTTGMTAYMAARLVKVYATLGKMTEAKKFKDVALKNLKKDGDAWHVSIGDVIYWYSRFSYDEVKVNSLIAEALLMLDPNDETAYHITQWLVNQDDASTYPNTHTKAFMLRAALAYIGGHSESKDAITAKVNVNGKEQTVTFADGAFSAPVTTLYPMSDIKGSAKVSITVDGGKKVYANALLSYIDPSQAMLSKLDYTLSRKIFKVDSQGNRTAFTGSAKVGDRFVVQVSTRTSSSDLQNIAIEDHLPAGLEAMNPALNDSSTISLKGGWADKVQYFDDRVFMNILNPKTNTYEYAAQAIAPGQFTYPSLYAYEMYNPAKYTRGVETMMTISE